MTIATKILLLMVVGLAGRENGGKAIKCRVLARYIVILSLTRVSTDNDAKSTAPIFTSSLIVLAGRILVPSVSTCRVILLES